MPAPLIAQQGFNHERCGLVWMERRKNGCKVLGLVDDRLDEIKAAWESIHGK